MNKNGFANVALFIFAVLVIVTGIFWFLRKDDSGGAGRMIAFEEALNAGRWEEVRDFLAPDGVNVALAGSECCDKKLSPEGTLIYLRLRNVKFVFDQQNPLVQEQLRKEVEDWVPSLHPEDYIWGVENDRAQPNKAAIGYRVLDNFVTDLLIRRGRDELMF